MRRDTIKSWIHYRDPASILALTPPATLKAINRGIIHPILPSVRWVNLWKNNKLRLKQIIIIVMMMDNIWKMYGCWES